MTQKITELVLYHLKDGISLEEVSSSNTSPAAQTLLNLVAIVKAQRGLRRQFWVCITVPSQ
jgi:hypothetical protein